MLVFAYNKTLREELRNTKINLRMICVQKRGKSDGGQQSVGGGDCRKDQEKIS